MSEFINIGISGVFTGCVLALLAIGYSIVFSSTGLLNLAQGGYIVLGTLLTYYCRTTLHLPLPIAILAAVIVVTAAALAFELIFISRSLGRLSSANLLIMMAGALLVLQGVALVAFGPNPVTLPTFTHPSQVDVGSIDVAVQGIWIVALTVLLIAALSWSLTRTVAGKALRASQDSPLSARLCGIPVQRMTTLSYGVSAALGAVAGAFVAPYSSVSSSSVFNYSVLGLVAVSLGGLGSVYGAVLGGLVLGIGQAYITGYVSTLFGTALSMAFLIAILALRPEGILSRSGHRRKDTNATSLGAIPITPRLTPRLARGLLVIAALIMLGLPQLSSVVPNLHLINIIGIFALTVIGLDLLSGTAGQVNLGQGGFMAVGGYISAYLMLQDVSPIVAIFCGMAGTLFVALLFGLVTRRLSGLYLGAVTLAFAILVEQTANGLGFLGGSEGLIGVPSFSVGGFSFDSDRRFYYLIWAIVWIVGIAVARLNSSQFGRLLKSLHGDPVATEMSGLNVALAKTVSLLIAAACASVAGSLYACYLHFLSPDMVGSATSLNLITMVIVGGSATTVGPVIGAALLTYLPTVSQRVATWFDVIEGLLLILVLRFLPSGLFGSAVAFVSGWMRRRRANVHSRERVALRVEPLVDGPAASSRYSSEETEGE